MTDAEFAAWCADQARAAAAETEQQLRQNVKALQEFFQVSETDAVELLSQNGGDFVRACDAYLNESQEAVDDDELDGLDERLGGGAMLGGSMAGGLGGGMAGGLGGGASSFGASGSAGVFGSGAVQQEESQQSFASQEMEVVFGDGAWPSDFRECYRQLRTVFRVNKDDALQRTIDANGNSDQAADILLNDLAIASSPEKLGGRASPSMASPAHDDSDDDLEIVSVSGSGLGGSPNIASPVLKNDQSFGWFSGGGGSGAFGGASSSGVGGTYYPRKNSGFSGVFGGAAASSSSGFSGAAAGPPLGSARYDDAMMRQSPRPSSGSGGAFSGNIFGGAGGASSLGSGGLGGRSGMQEEVIDLVSDDESPLAKRRKMDGEGFDEL